MPRTRTDIADPAPTARSHAAETDIGLLIGPNLKRLRHERNLSLEMLAAKAGVSRAMLSQIERGASVPTINTVWKLARAFDLPFSALIADSLPQPISDLPAASALRLKSASGKMSSRALFPPESTPRAEFYELRMDPGAVEASDPHSEGAVENLVVASGRLEVAFGDTVHALGPGDAILFPGDQLHTYRNPGPEEAVAFLVMSYPDAQRP